MTLPAGYEKMTLPEILDAAGPMERFQAIMARVQRMPKGEIESALKEMKKFTQGRFDPESMFATHLLLTRYGQEDHVGALAYLKGQDVWTQGFGMSTVLSSLASRDPKAAAEYFKDENNAALNMPQISGFMSGAVAKEWARQDPEGALTWAKGLREGLGGGAMASIIGSVAVQDPQKAAGMISDLKSGDDKNRVIDSLAQGWGARAPEEAMKWAATLNGEERTKALAKTLEGWAGNDPASAAAYVSQSATSGERDKLLAGVAGPWSRKEPDQAAAWLQSQAEGKGKEEATRQLMWTWTAAQPAQASTWLAQQPEGPSKDEGIITMAGQTFSTDPEAAVTWAATIGDADKRKTHLKRGVEGWLKKDEPAALRWLQSSSSLTPEERTSFVPVKK